LVGRSPRHVNPVTRTAHPVGSVGAMGDGPGRGTGFDRVAAEYDVSRGGEERATANARDVARHLPAGDVLEIGVGTGLVAAALRRAVPALRLAGVDIAAGMLDRARDRLPGGLVRASALRLPFPGACLDGVVAVHVLHLVDDQALALAEAARVLRPGGRVVAVHGGVELPPDELTEATRPLSAVTARPDTPDGVRLAAGDRLRVVAQHPSEPRRARHTPAELADLFERRIWSSLWALDDDRWNRHVEPVIAALRALPDQNRPRVQVGRMTVTVLERPA
jgi:SAM-dependent methyltransferase